MRVSKVRLLPWPLLLMAPLLLAQSSGEPNQANPDKAKAGAPPAAQDGKPGEAPAAPQKDPTQDKEFQMKVWNVINSTGPAIDQCTQRYTSEQPGKHGTVEISIEIQGTGLISKAAAKSTLPTSEKLQQCMKFVAQGWRFPAMEGVKSVSTSMSIQVAKDKKFTLLKPGEQPPKPEPGKPPEQPSGFLGFQPLWSPTFVGAGGK